MLVPYRFDVANIIIFSIYMVKLINVWFRTNVEFQLIWNGESTFHTPSGSYEPEGVIHLVILIWYSTY
jgi:hypothetical protein